MVEERDCSVSHKFLYFPNNDSKGFLYFSRKLNMATNQPFLKYRSRGIYFIFNYWIHMNKIPIFVLEIEVRLQSNCMIMVL